MASLITTQELPQSCEGDTRATSPALRSEFDVPAPAPRGEASDQLREMPGTPTAMRSAQCAQLVTFVTHEALELAKLRASAAAVGAALHVVFVPERFGPRHGWGPRLLAMYEFVSDAARFPDPRAVVICVDGFDVLIKRPLAVAVSEFEAMAGSKLGECVLLSAETACSPDAGIAHQFPPTGTPYAFPNAGTLMGHVGAMRQLLGSHLAEFQVPMDDQLWWQKRYLEELPKGPEARVLLDAAARVFQCLWGATDHFERDPASGLWRNKLTKCVRACSRSLEPGLTSRFVSRRTLPSIWHGNGGLNAFLFETFGELHVSSSDATRIVACS